MIIGICGKSGSGKSTLSKKLIEIYDKNIVHLDIDKIGHKVLETEEVKEELKKAFGNNIIDNDKIDRKKLSNIVFESRKEHKKLSDITWKYMEIEIDNFINSNKDKIIILDWLLLILTKYFQMCDLKVLLDIPYEIRKERALKRDSISEEKFDLREKASIDFDINDFDYVINENSEDEIKRLVKLI